MTKTQRSDNYKKLYRIVSMLLILSIEAYIFWRSWYGFYNINIIFPFYRKGHIVMVGFYVFLLILCLNLFGGLKIGYYKLSTTILSQILAVVFANVLVYIQIMLLAAKPVSIRPLLFATGLDILWLVVLSLVLELVFVKIFPPKRLLVIYGDYPASGITNRMNSRKEKFKVMELAHISQDTEILKEKILEYDAVVICDLAAEQRNNVLKYCYEQSIRCYITPKISDIIIRSAENLHFFDTPLLLARNKGLSSEQEVIKRLSDIVFSILLIILTSPVMLVIAVAIKVSDRGPVIFTQRRMTKGGKIFRIYKFRSMVVDAEKDGEVIPAAELDARVTKVGRWIRRTRLDELPQLFNVLKGEMSLVGPRPERIEHVQLYTEKIPEFSYRLKVKAGLTGYAQVFGKYNTLPYDKLKMDLTYIENYSFWLDLRILVMTVKVLFMKETTEGFGDEQSRWRS